VSEAAGQVKEKVQDLASGAAQRVEDAWESTRQGVRQGAQAVAHTAQDFWTDTTDLIRRYPVAAVGIAFGLGCLTALCCSAFSRTDDMARRMAQSSA
jgi:ElaB/YqjD/DUF883 family membrane-anchored ribosome-binding protein